MSTPTAGNERPVWRRVLPEPVRELGRPLIHAWQRHAQAAQIRKMQKLASKERRVLLDEATPIIKDVYGYRFVVYRYDKPNILNLSRHPADAAELKAIPRLVGPGDVAFDIGANIGLYTVLLSRLCGASGRVWAFEPVPETYWRLRETLALNRCDNVVPVQAAVCDRDGIATMNLFESAHSEWNTLARPEWDPSGRKVGSLTSVEVPSLNLDRFCEAQKIERINFLKVDVEGFEVSVFKGAEELLRRKQVDYICFEISRRPLRSAGFSGRDVFRAIEKHGYSVFALDRATGAFGGPIHDTDAEWTNFFASTKDMTVL